MPMTLDQVLERGRTVMREHANYSLFVDSCINIMIQAHEFGWKVAVYLNGERAVNRAESLLGIHIRSDFAPQTELSKLIYGP